MELLQFTISAGETKRFEVAGRYLEIIEAADRLNIDFNGPDGNRVHSMRGALSGFYSEEPFQAFEVGNPSATQTVKLMITDRRGGSRRQPGVVRVVDEVTSALQCAVNAPSTAVSVFSATPIVLPAANVRGLVMRWAATTAASNAGGSAFIGYVVAPSAPTNYSTPAQRYPLLSAFANSIALVDRNLQLSRAFPPGWGLYLVTEVAGVPATSLAAQVGFELL